MVNGSVSLGRSHLGGVERWFKDSDRNTWLKDKKGLDYVNNTYVLKCRATKYASSYKRRVCYIYPILDGRKERVLTNFEVE